MKSTSIFSSIRFVFFAKKIWSKPKKVSHLIYDREGASDFFQYLDDYEVGIFEVRGESFNVSVLFSCIMKYGFRVNFERYAGEYILAVNPKVVLTFIDNAIIFYRMKSYSPETKFVSVQNGHRDNVLFEIISETFLNDELLQADAIFCFGSAIAKKYANLISTKTYPMGSFKNNKIPKSIKPINRFEILYISQYRPPVFRNGIPGMPVGEKHILWDDFYKSEYLLLPSLLKSCKKNGYDLKICGTSFNDYDEEELYYNSLLGEEGWSYVAKERHLSSYESLDQSEIIAFIDSTLGYEALGRGAKVMAFPARGIAIGADDRGFGWPLKLPSKGKFWANKISSAEVDRVFSYVGSVSDNDWVEDNNQIISGLMGFSERNKKFVGLLKEFSE